MTQKDKKLLLKDLCIRLPYGVLCQISGDASNTPRKLSRIEVDELDGILLDFWTNRESYLSIQVYLGEVKPYLRPMSSMTEDEKSNYHNYKYWIEKGDIEHCTINMIDWLNSHHFDYRGLIEKGLALEAPEDMYNNI